MSKESRNKLRAHREVSAFSVRDRQVLESTEKRWVLPSSVLIGILTLFVYGKTLLPTLGGGDSGEFISVVYKSGVLHPPGFPLYFLLAKAFSFLPFGSIAFRINFFSGFCTALTAAALVLLMKKWSGSLWAGVLTAGLYAFSPLVWTYATSAEVFSLNSLILVTFFWFSLDVFSIDLSNEKKLRSLKVLSFLFGLGLSNHHICVFFMGPLFLYCLVRARRFSQGSIVKVILNCIALLFLGLTPYLCLICFARIAPEGNNLNTVWGDTGSVAGLLFHFFRRDYGTLSLFAADGSQKSSMKGFLHYFKHLPEQVLYLGLTLSVVGGFYSMRERSVYKEFGKLLSGLLLFYIVVFHFLAVGAFNDSTQVLMLSRFWLQSDLILFCWCGYSVLAARNMISSDQLKKWVIPLVVLGLIVIQYLVQFRRQDQSQNYHLERYGRAILDALPPRSLLLVGGDAPSNAIEYLQNCLDYRKDVIVLGQTRIQGTWTRKRIPKELPELSVPSRTTLNAWIDANIDRYPVFSVPDLELDRNDPVQFDVLPYGLSYRVFRKGTRNLGEFLLSDSKNEIFKLDSFLELRKESEYSWENWLWRHYAIAFDSVGTQLINQKLYVDAIQYYERYNKLEKDLPGQIYGNMGLAYYMLYQQNKDPEMKAGARRSLNLYLEGADRSESGTSQARALLNAL